VQTQGRGSDASRGGELHAVLAENDAVQPIRQVPVVRGSGVRRKVLNLFCSLLFCVIDCFAVLRMFGALCLAARVLLFARTTGCKILPNAP
jgi:hypothetical protein